MNLNHSTLRRAPGWLRAALLLVLLGGCGGGVDSGGTGGAAVYASGPINGFGSIVVNGVHFDDSTGTISDDDGAPRTRSDLKLGMVAEMRGSAITVDAFGDSNSTAASIVIGSEIVGPIDAGSITSNSLTVLGRPIDVQPTTVFEPGSSLAALAQGNVVEVYGLYNAVTDRFTATRIERKSNPLHYKVRGKVTALNGSLKTFSIGALPLHISYFAIPSENIPVGLADGAIVRIGLDTTPVVGVWTANRLRGGVSNPDDGRESKVEGLVDSVTSATQFSVSGVAVTAIIGQTQFDLTGGAIVVGARLQVEGAFVNGTLAANKVEVEFDSGDDFDFRGLLQDVNGNAKTLTIQGVSIDYATVNDFGSGHTAADLIVGTNVRVRASLVGGTQLKAYRIQFRN